MKHPVLIVCLIGVGLLISGVCLGASVVALRGGFAFLTTPMDTHTYTVEEPFTSIAAENLDVTDVTLVPADGENTVLTVVSDRYTTYTATVEHGTLTIRACSDSPWYARIGVVSGDFSLTLALPQDTYHALSIATATGSIDIPSSFQWDTVTLRSSTGDILCHAAVKETLSLHTQTGDVSATHAAPRTMDLQTSTGSITLRDIPSASIQLSTDTGNIQLTDVTCDTLTAESHTGDMLFQNTLASGKIQLTSNTGDITLTSCDGGELTVETSTGDVCGTLLSDKLFFADTSTGDITLPDTRSGGACRVVTDTGDITFEVLPHTTLSAK